MKVLHFIPAWGLGGAEKVIDEIIRNCSADIETTILTFKVVGPHLNNDKIVCLKANPLTKYIRFLCFILKYRPAVVHGHMTPTIPFLIILCLLNRNIKLVYTVHGEYKRSDLWSQKVLDYLFYSKLNIRIVSVSEFSFSSIKRYWDISHLVILNGISPLNFTSSRQIVEEIESYKKSPRTKIFITIARIVPVKNLELMVTAFKQLAEKHDIVLIIIGHDPASDQEELIKLKKIASGNIVFLGSRLNATDYLAFADAFCMSSISEALPITLIEAISVGVPVLSTNVGGIPEVIVNGLNGFLSKDLSVANYAKLITDFLSLSPREIADLKQNSLKRYKELFTFEKMYSQYLSLYQNGI